MSIASSGTIHVHSERGQIWPRMFRGAEFGPAVSAVSPMLEYIYIHVRLHLYMYIPIQRPGLLPRMLRPVILSRRLTLLSARNQCPRRESSA